MLGVQYAPLVFLTLRAGLRTLPRELIEAGLAGGAGPFTVLRTIVLPLMTPPLVAGVALDASSPASAISASPRCSASPATIWCCRRSSTSAWPGSGPGVLSEVSVLSMLIGFIAVVGILLQDLMLRRRDFRISTTSSVARAVRARAAGACRSRSRCGRWSALVLALPLVALVLTSFVPAVGVPLTCKTATLANYDFVLFGHDAARRALVNSFGMSATAAIAIVADRGAARATSSSGAARGCCASSIWRSRCPTRCPASCSRSRRSCCS